MMADDNQSSSPSTVADIKPQKEEDVEEKVPKSESESNDSPKIPNGVANHVSDNIPDTNANHIQECNGNVVRESSVNTIDADQENNNSADSLEEDNTDHVEEKTYTSTLEQALIVKEVKQVSSETTVVTSSTVVEEVHKIQTNTPQTETQELKREGNEGEEVRHVENTATTKVDTAKDSGENSISEDNAVQEMETTKDLTQVSCEKDVVAASVEETVIKDYQEKLESLSEKLVILDVKSADEDEDGFVPVEECLPKDDNPDEEVDLPTENFEPSVEEPEIAPSTNGFGEALPLSPTDSTSSEKVNHPEMEQFVKSGGVKRIIPGVQKTEQPYNTCTTETKIAMEIREMREREEELRIMREQALLSPAPSPVPPKTPSTPSMPSSSPSPKEGVSPVPQGPGYRVSSVFGHKGAVSPSLPFHEEKKSMKSFNKESAVEKEIRLAKDREEELRKQKGLPPREDDSYVKPSEVKSSQVRVFGKVAGGNNNSVKQAATAKIQMEIEEQTQREMALRETGHIQTISQERTDAKVAKLKTADTHVHTNGNSSPPVNGTHTNGNSGHSSPDYSVPYKRSSPSPTNARPASIFAQNTGLTKSNVSMHKFISSKGKETTFNSPRSPFLPKDETSSRPVVPPTMVKLKRNVSVESKIQQEIMEMKQREEELRKMHMNMTKESNGENEEIENGLEDEMNQKNNFENGNGIVSDEEISPRHNKLIAQWELRIQKAES